MRKTSTYSLGGLLLIMAMWGCRIFLPPQGLVLRQPAFFPSIPPTQNPATVEGVALGRMLFYDPILSQDSSFSCASCHRQASAFADGGQRFSLGLHGDSTKRNTQPLFNLNWPRQFFWDGRSASLEDQAFHPVRDQKELDLDWASATERIQRNPRYIKAFRAAFGRAEIDSTLIAKAIAQFEQTLISNNSKFDRVLRGEERFSPDELQGFILANDQAGGDCLHCHPTDAHALGTTNAFSNNGLQSARSLEDLEDLGLYQVTGNPADAGKFRIPSLRNVALTAPYMHDGRFASLEAVIDFYSEGLQANFNIDSKMQFAHQGGLQLDSLEKRQLIAFLHTLTDSTFIQNPAFSNPFQIEATTGSTSN